MRVFVCSVNECTDPILGDCGEHGDCSVDADGHAVCTCDWGRAAERWAGERCDQHQCRRSDHVCYNGGTCK